MKDFFSKSFLYRHRVVIGFFLVGFALYYFIVFGFARVPGGLSQLETASAALSGNLAFPDAIVGLPYHFLQWLSMSLFDVSNFSIRLPSVLLGMLSGGLVIAAVRNFIKDNVAVVTGLVIASSVFFLNFARLGAPIIMSIFLLSLAIFAISQIVNERRHKTLWLLVLVLAVIIGVYQPMGTFFALALAIVAPLHPRTRALIKRLKIWQTVLAAVVGLAMLAPLVYALVLDSSLVLPVLGLDNIKYLPSDVWASLQALTTIGGQAAFGLVTPFISLAELVLVIIGIVNLARDSHSARSYLILGLGLVALVLSLLDITKAYLLFLPLVFLVAYGIQAIISKWYSLFPLNPYARLFGLLPIGLLLLSVVSSNYATYTFSSFYSDTVVYQRSEVFMAAKKEVNRLSAHDVDLVVAPEQLDFFRLLEREYPNLTVSTRASSDSDVRILTPAVFDQTSLAPTRVVTNSHKFDNVMLKIYQQ